MIQKTQKERGGSLLVVDGAVFFPPLVRWCCFLFFFQKPFVGDTFSRPPFGVGRVEVFLLLATRSTHDKNNITGCTDNFVPVVQRATQSIRHDPASGNPVPGTEVEETMRNSLDPICTVKSVFIIWRVWSLSCSTLHKSESLGNT